MKSLHLRVCWTISNLSSKASQRRLLCFCFVFFSWKMVMFLKKSLNQNVDMYYLITAQINELKQAGSDEINKVDLSKNDQELGQETKTNTSHLSFRTLFLGLKRVFPMLPLLFQLLRGRKCWTRSNANLKVPFHVSSKLHIQFLKPLLFIDSYSSFIVS